LTTKTAPAAADPLSPTTLASAVRGVATKEVSLVEVVPTMVCPIFMAMRDLIMALRLRFSVSTEKITWSGPKT